MEAASAARTDPPRRARAAGGRASPAGRPRRPASGLRRETRGSVRRSRHPCSSRARRRRRPARRPSTRPRASRCARTRSATSRSASRPQRLAARSRRSRRFRRSWRSRPHQRCTRASSRAAGHGTRARSGRRQTGRESPRSQPFRLPAGAAGPARRSRVERSVEYARRSGLVPRAEARPARTLGAEMEVRLRRRLEPALDHARGETQQLRSSAAASAAVHSRVAGASGCSRKQ